MKQPGALFILFGAASILCNDIRRRATFKTIASAYFDLRRRRNYSFRTYLSDSWQAGVFEKFWFWTVNYAANMAPCIPLRAAPPFFAREWLASLIRSGWALWILGGLGVVGGLWNKRSRVRRSFSSGLLAVSLLALSAGFYFREHYFIFVLPAVSLLCGLAISTLSDFVASRSRLDSIYAASGVLRRVEHADPCRTKILL